MSRPNKVPYTGMSISKELENRLFYLADPKIVWRRGQPCKSGQACLVEDFDPVRGVTVDGLTITAQFFLDRFVRYYAANDADSFPTAVGFNDQIAKSRQEVLWMLEEAIAEAKEQGV